MPIRFSNHAESATSSRLLALAASPATSIESIRDSGANTMLSIRSHTNGETYSRGAQVTRSGSRSDGSGRHGTDTIWVSVSTVHGSTSGNLRGVPAHAADTHS